MWLTEQIKQVESAKHKYDAAQALNKHRRLQAKARVSRLMSSAKGISAAFGAGMIKGWSGDRDQAMSSGSSGLITLISKQALSGWLAGGD